jgi:hypothetical protein
MQRIPGKILPFIAALVKIWKQERAAMFSGTILPIGKTPDGTSWTGFASAARDAKSGHILLFRETNERSGFSLKLPDAMHDVSNITILAGEGTLEWKRRRVLFHDWTPDDAGAHDENVEVYSNAAEVELFLNEQSLGKKATRKDAGSLNWKIPYQPGTLKAVAFNDGKEVASDTLRTAGKLGKLAVLADQATLGAGFDDVAHLEIHLLDENGTVVPTAGDLVQFTVTGPGKIIAVDSGSVVSIEPFQADQRRAFQGRALAILRATGAGEITVTAKVDGLPPATVKVIGKP